LGLVTIAEGNEGLGAGDNGEWLVDEWVEGDKGESGMDEWAGGGGDAVVERRGGLGEGAGRGFRRVGGVKVV
jgi:hypothetical protein